MMLFAIKPDLTGFLERILKSDSEEQFYFCDRINWMDRIYSHTKQKNPVNLVYLNVSHERRLGRKSPV